MPSELLSNCRRFLCAAAAPAASTGVAVASPGCPGGPQRFHVAQGSSKGICSGILVRLVRIADGCRSQTVDLGLGRKNWGYQSGHEKSSAVASVTWLQEGVPLL